MTTTNLTRTHSPLPALLACAVVGCMVILAVYWLRAPNPILARLPYAVMVSVLPAVIGWPIAAWWRLSRKWVVVVYVGVFVVTVLVQAGVR